MEILKINFEGIIYILRYRNNENFVGVEVSSSVSLAPNSFAFWSEIHFFVTNFILSLLIAFPHDIVPKVKSNTFFTLTKLN